LDACDVKSRLCLVYDLADWIFL